MRCLNAAPTVSRFLTMTRFARAWVVILLLSLGGRAGAQTLTTIASFNGTGGTFPQSGLTLIGSSLYGTTVGGGPSNAYGTVFSVPLSGGTPSVLAFFNGTDGESPNSNLTLSGSTLYGTTDGGSVNESGTVFNIPLSGGTPTVLASFSAPGQNCPVSNLTLGGSTLYGTTEPGMVFSIPVAGGSPVVLANTGLIYPSGGLTLIGSKLYGASEDGGPAGYGTVFSIPLTGGTPTVLGFFNGTGAAGEFPTGGLTLIGSTLYGTTHSGGTDGDGTVFSIPLSGGTPTALSSFNGDNGAYPNAGLTLVGSTLYGTANAGQNAASDGVVFSVPLSGGTPTDLVTFNGTNGSGPLGGLTLVGSSLYGTTSGGGPGPGPQYGTVFALNISQNAIADQSNHSNVFGPLIASPVLAGESYAGLATTVVATTGSGGGPMLGTTATILAGTNSGSFTGGAATVSMAWRTRTFQESSVAEGGTPSSPPLPYKFSPLISDVLNLSGMSNSANAPAPSDVFALEMTYDPSLLSNEAAQATGGAIYLAWLNSTAGPGGVPLWQNAILGDTGNNATSADMGFLGSFSTFQADVNDTSLADYIGAWGVDTANHDVWAVVNFNGDFAVVPEPSTLVLLGLSAAGLIGYRLRRKAPKTVSAYRCSNKLTSQIAATAAQRARIGDSS